MILFCYLLFLPLYFQHLSLHHFIIECPNFTLLKTGGEGEGFFLLVKRGGMSKILHDVEGGGYEIFLPLKTVLNLIMLDDIAFLWPGLEREKHCSSS